MRLIVVQSYRTRNVPPWITRCTETVRSWAAARGYEYAFHDDSFLNLAPPWYRERAARHLVITTDLARLRLARDLLASHYDRVVWVDADVIVFDPAALDIPVTQGFAFCREIWTGLDISPGNAGKAIVRFDERVNNAVCTFGRNNSLLDFYIEACQAIVAGRAPEALAPLDVGTQFLTGLYRLVPLPLLTQIGTLSPLLIHALATDTRAIIQAYAQAHAHPIHAAHLCASLSGAGLSEIMIEAAIDRLLATRGAVVNQHLPPSTGDPLPPSPSGKGPG